MKWRRLVVDTGPEELFVLLLEKSSFLTLLFQEVDLLVQLQVPTPELRLLSLQTTHLQRISQNQSASGHP